jgi:hypothetical protein
MLKPEITEKKQGEHKRVVMSRQGRVQASKKIPIYKNANR